MIGTIARAALISRGHLPPENLDPRAKTEGLAPSIPKADERDLQWSYAEDRQGAESAGGSNFGTMLERMELLNKSCRSCVACGGIREVVHDGVIEVEEKGGSGFITGGRDFADYMRLAHIAVLKRSRSAYLREHSGEGDPVCPKCKGSGWIVRARKKTGRPPTVQITGQIPPTMPATTGGSDHLARRGRIERKKSAVRAVNPLVADALEALYSPDGGDASALWHLTPEGKNILEGNVRGLAHQAYFRAVRGAQELNQDPAVAQSFKRAEKQARQLKDLTARVWCEVHGLYTGRAA